MARTATAGAAPRARRPAARDGATRSRAARRIQLDDPGRAGVARDRRRRVEPEDDAMTRARRLDAVALAVLHHRLAAIADEMGVVLGRSGFSPNIKERHDYSCAIFDPAGRMVAHAAHVPVHLGSTPLSVRAALAAFRLQRGDVVALNDPYAGGTHLPDVTLVAPTHDGRGRLLGFVADRAHHADIGGMTP